MTNDVDSKIYGRAELIALLGGLEAGALGEPYRITPTGVMFEPDPVAWATLTDEERLAVMPTGWTPGVPVLAFPFDAPGLLRFIEHATLPALLRWCDPDPNDPTALAGLEGHPKAHHLAMLLAGGIGRGPDAKADAAAATFQGQQQDGVATTNHRVAKRWTPQLVAEARAVLHRMKAQGHRDYAARTAEQFGVTPQRLRKMLAAHKTKATWYPRTTEAPAADD